MKIYRATMEKWGKASKKWIESDIEDFNRDLLREKIKNAMNDGWFFKRIREYEATENQIETGKYLNMI